MSIFHFVFSFFLLTLTDATNSSLRDVPFFGPVNRQSNFNKCNVNGAIVVTVQSCQQIGGFQVTENGVPNTFNPINQQTGSFCPFGSTSLQRSCNQPTDCGQNFGSVQCIGNSCCLFSSQSGCSNGGQPLGRQCQSSSQCSYSTVQGVVIGDCLLGSCCTRSNNGQLQQCQNGGIPQGRSCNSQFDCLNGYQCVFNQCCSSAIGTGSQCPQGTTQSPQFTCFSGLDSECRFQQQGGQLLIGYCRSQRCCMPLSGGNQPQCMNGGQPMGLPFCSYDQQCVDNFTGSQRQGRCIQGACCTQGGIIGGQCPLGQQSLGRSCQSNFECSFFDPNTQQQLQGQCYQGLCCGQGSIIGQCPFGRRALGRSCQSNFQCQYVDPNTRRQEQAECVQGSCCVQSTIFVGQCPVGQQSLGRSCQSNFECSYFDPNTQQQRQGQCYQGACCGQSSISSGICTTIGMSPMNRACQSSTDCSYYAGTQYRNGVCYQNQCCQNENQNQCSNGRQDLGVSCSINQQCQFNAVCENGRCCGSNSVSNCPQNTQSLGRSCTSQFECAYLEGTTTRQGQCYNGNCCSVSSFTGTDQCSAYGMRHTGEFCQTSNLQVCQSIGGNVQCINGYCCTSGLNPPIGQGIAYCYDGSLSQRTCRRSSDCQSNQSCMNGLCCTTTGNEWKFACAGIGAVASCFTDGTCVRGLPCVPSNYCCECEFGQSVGQCTHGCPPNYRCTRNFCCPQCPNNQQPRGSCYKGRCGNGYQCVSGNICCPSTFG
ncbi:hypothetical protein M3Y95_00789400 [Aphelenchoides besseyi]|nr:hypothetical protein M3Y95_00789400 [Aphelenchoides besseyi]